MKKHLINNDQQQLVIQDHEELLIVDDRAEAGDLEIIIGEHCRVHYVWLFQGTGHQPITRTIKLGDHSRLEAWQIYNCPSEAKLVIDNQLGEQVSFDNHVLFYQSGSNKLSVQDNYHFNKPGAYGRFNIEGMVNGQAQVEYFSDLQIKPNSQKIDSRIDMKLHLLSEQCRGMLLPGLQIDANDVKAGHSATTFKLTPEDLFYLSSRGLSADQIKSLVIDSTVNRFVSGLDDAELKDKIIKSLRPDTTPV